MMTAPSGQLVVRLLAGRTLSGPSLDTLGPAVASSLTQVVRLDLGLVSLNTENTTEQFIIKQSAHLTESHFMCTQPTLELTGVY